ncbi:MAG: S41 family peptidase [Bacteroidota bacterium]
MKRNAVFISTYLLLYQFVFAQDFGDYQKIRKDKLLNDLEILYQALDNYHSGMYWYTPKDSVDLAFDEVKKKITTDLNVLEFNRLIAPLVALSREDHTNIYLPESTMKKLDTESQFMPLHVVFLGTKLYLAKNGSNHQEFPIEGMEIELINGEKPTAIVNKIGSLFASDGFIKIVKFSDLNCFNFSKYYFYYYGQINQFEIKLKHRDDPLLLKSLKIPEINKNLETRYPNIKIKEEKKELLQYKMLHSSIAYLGIHSFSNSDIREASKEKKIKPFLKNSFRSIHENKISTLIVDVSKNGGGTEGNDGLLFSYLGENYQKYVKVRAKTQKAILDNETDAPINLKTFGFFEKTLMNKKMEDGSLERREWIGHGLMAYKKEPKYKFSGKVYIIISPITYSGGSEFSNMVYTRDLATFVGQETGGGYLGNTSGYSKELVLPNSKITIDIPSLQFVMNVTPKLPFGRGVIPHYEVIPTYEQFLNGENAALKFILEQLEKTD